MWKVSRFQKNDVWMILRCMDSQSKLIQVEFVFMARSLNIHLARQLLLLAGQRVYEGRDNDAERSLNLSDVIRSVARDAH